MYRFTIFLSRWGENFAAHTLFSLVAWTFKKRKVQSLYSRKRTLEAKIIRLLKSDTTRKNVVQSYNSKNIEAHLNKIRQKLKYARWTKKRAVDKVNILKNNLKKSKTEIAKLSVKSSSENIKLHYLNKNQETIIKEILYAAQKTTTNNRRYTENWILLSMLLRMRSPATYNFLRDNGIIPLPSIRTICRYVFENEFYIIKIRLLFYWRCKKIYYKILISDI